MLLFCLGRDFAWRRWDNFACITKIAGPKCLTGSLDLPLTNQSSVIRSGTRRRLGRLYYD